MATFNLSNQFYLNNCKKIFNKFLETQKHLKDVSLVGSDGTFIKCHQFVLSACSPFFEKVLDNYNKHKTTENNGEVVLLLGAHTTRHIQSIVDFIYHGNVPVFESNNDEDNDNNGSLFRLANELQISGLNETLLEKRQSADEISEERKSKDVIVNFINGKLGYVNNEATSRSSQDSSSSDTSTIEKQPKKEKKLICASEDILKSSSSYEYWLKRLSKIEKRQALKNKPLQDKNPHDLLNEIIEGIKYCYPSDYNGVHMCIAKIDGQSFTGRGTSQQAARLDTIKLILKKIFDITYDRPMSTAHIISPISDALGNLSQQFEDTVERLILEKYTDLMSNDNYYSCYKVIAGIVQSDDSESGNLRVVSIGTGSKFLYEKYLHKNGNTVNDTHAEVVARRGLIRYLYNEVNQCIGNSSKSIFQKSSNSSGQYKLQSNVKFHLYISTSPCGDARIYSHANVRNPICNGVSVILEGQLRTKGQGALTISKDLRPDDINEANCMSCSAKLLKWNVLGIQGALLSKIIEPIYLSSIILGEKFEHKHLERAMYGRVDKEIANLPKGFTIKLPNLMHVSKTKAKSASFSPNHSVNWNGQSCNVEILQSTSGRTTGKDETKLYSRISKRAFYIEYNKLAKKLNYRLITDVYSKAKADAQDYQDAKSILFGAFKDNGIGTWIQKQCDDFRI